MSDKWSQLLNFMNQILDGLLELKNHSIAHRDLKPEVMCRFTDLEYGDDFFLAL